MYYIIDVTTSILMFLRLFFKREEINKVKDITMIDPEDDTKYLPVENIYLGSDIHSLLQSDEYINREELVKDVRIRCRQFMITACKEIKKEISAEQQEI